MRDFSSNALVAKLRAMYGKSLTYDDFSEMMRKTTVSEIASFLKANKQYKDVLGSIQESFVHRGQLENLLRKSLFYRYVNIAKYTDKTNHFYDYITLGLEIEQLLDCIRHLCTGHTEKMIISVPGFFIPYSSFNLLQLADATNFDELLKVVKKTPFYALLLPFKPTFGIIDFTGIETVLKTYYFTRKSAAIEKYSTRNERIKLLKMFDIEVKLYNLAIIYRLKVFYNANADVINRHIIQTGKSTWKKSFERLMSTNDKTSFLREFNAITGDKYFNDLQDVYIENSVNKIENKMAKRELRFSTDAKLSFMSYMILGKIEIYNIINIVEGVRYKVKPEQMEKFLI